MDVFALFSTAEFWSAIAGSIVGGAIAAIIQLMSLRESRDQRANDRLNVQKSLATSLIFKLIRIASNLQGISAHFEQSLQEAKQKGMTGQPWQFVIPLANPPDQVHFSPDEMGMLISLGENEITNSVMQMDVVHNSLVSALKVFNTERIALGERVAAISKIVNVDGSHLEGSADAVDIQALLPKMIEVNTLIDHIRKAAESDSLQARTSTEKALALFRNKLKIQYKMEFKDNLPAS